MSYSIKTHNVIKPAEGQIWDDGKKRYEIVKIAKSPGNWDGRTYVKFAALDKHHITHHWQDLTNFREAFPHAAVWLPKGQPTQKPLRAKKEAKDTMGPGWLARSFRAATRASNRPIWSKGQCSVSAGWANKE